MVLCFVLYVGGEAGYGAWIYTYAFTLNFGTEVTAAYLTSAFWGSFTLGRLFGIWVSTRLRPMPILLLDFAGCILSVGVILLFPNFDQTRAVMQDAWAVHAIAALIYIAISFGHIYMGTIGVEGAYGNMRTGYTDETWAKEHHSVWYDEVKSARGPAAGGAVPAGAPHMKEKT